MKGLKMTSWKLTMLAGSALALTLVAGCGDSGNDGVRLSSQMPADEFEAASDRPPTAMTLYRMGKLLMAQEKVRECDAVLRNAISRYPDFLPAYTELAALHVRQGKIEGAMHVLGLGLQQSPMDAVILNDLGMCFMLRGEYAEALESFEMARNNGGQNMRYHANVALAAGMLGQYDQAFTVYQEIMGDGMAHYNLAVICEARKDFDRAATEFAAAKALGVHKGT